MREFPLVTAAQLRAARALLDWSQEQLANVAGVGLSTVRDFEKERRGGETAALRTLREALQAAGVVFLSGTGDLGPGVQLRATLPNVLRRPMKPSKWGALVVDVEWRGREAEICAPRDVLDMLAGLDRTDANIDPVSLFDRNRLAILRAAAAAMDAGRLGSDQRVALTPADFAVGLP